MRRSTGHVETKALSNVISSPCEAEAQTVAGFDRVVECAGIITAEANASAVFLFVNRLCVERSTERSFDSEKQSEVTPHGRRKYRRYKDRRTKFFEKEVSPVFVRKPFSNRSLLPGLMFPLPT